MKLITARIKNFKLLRDIKMEFSIDSEKPLTVIRAEVGSGKTSTLQALRWALYGKDVLDEPQVRLSPADWPDTEPCLITVEIDFVHSTVSYVEGTAMIATTNYMLKRQVEERPEGDVPNRGREIVSLFERKTAGSDPIKAAESRLAQMLPKEMIDIFFTDGDAAMTFISPQVSDKAKKDKVKAAIRSLLGLELLEGVERRISIVQSDINKKIINDTTSDKLKVVTEEIEKYTKQKNEHSESVTKLDGEIDSIERKLDAVTRELTKALEAGSYEQLSHQRKFYKNQLDQASEEEASLRQKHQELFESENLSWGLLEPVLQNGYDHLKLMHAEGIIPKATVPVLEERLNIERCICGTDLSEGTNARKIVSELIAQHRERDAEVDYLSSLYYQAQSEVEKWRSDDAKKWLDDVSELKEQRVSVTTRIDGAHRELSHVEKNLDQIDEEKIELKRSQEQMLQSSLRQQNTTIDRAKVSLLEARNRLSDLEKQQKILRGADDRVTVLNATKTTLEDLQQVVTGALQEMQSTYLKRVSSRMNELFLEMVGADPENDGVFQGVEINDDYSIIVNTLDGRTLNPDYEVNGASKRALTFAFIWALTEVSDVVAPRVIDTPLGMMSGRVKRRVLEILSKAAGNNVDRQVVLFLTQSEVSHTESTLDSQTGKAFTLIKTDDYPIDLVNDPGADQSEIRLCHCNHRQYCKICQRYDFKDFQLTYRSV